jgi:glycosyltransferase involved in cell wall biosynthesis
MSQYLPGLLVRALSILERSLLKKVDYMITVSPLIVQKYSAFSGCPIQTVQNFLPLKSYNSITPEMMMAARLSLGLSPDDYFVVYIGGFSLNRMLLPLIEAVSRLPDVQLILWGDGQQKSAVQKALRNIPNARYLGWASSENVALFTSLADVIYYCIKPDYPFSSPNTLSNAMLAGRPILANRVGDLGQIVEETGCGILLYEVTPGAIHSALETLRDPALRQKLGNAGREAAEEQYNWENEAKKLLDVYENLN